MATIEELTTALINADKAGDAQAATILAQEITKLQNTTQQKPQSIEYGEETFNQYFEGQMSPQEMANFEDLVKQGTIKLPENVTTQPYAREQDTPNNLTGLKLIKQPTISEKVVGGLEAGLSTATGLTSGAAGQIAGTLKGLYDQIISGEFGTQKAAQEIKKTAEEVGQSLSYIPSTQEGQQYVENIAQVAEPLVALTPLATEIGSATRSLQSTKPIVEKAPIIKETPKTNQVEIIAEISKKAIKGDKNAQAQLAQEVKLNPQAVNAADRLGIELPADVLGDSELIKQTAGLVRSQIGESSSDWTNTVTRAVEKADETMNSLGKTNIAEMSDKILNNLKTSVKDLDIQSSKIYNETIKIIPKNTSVKLNNSLNKMNEIIDDIGGTKLLNPEEKRLYNLLNQENITLGALERERRQIGQALGKNPQGQYAKADQSMLKSIYSALKQDQLDNIETIAGVEARDKLHLADRLFQKKMAIEKRIVDNFGKDADGSISTLLTRAINQGSKGDVAALNKVLKNVPQELQKETLITALGDVTSSKRGIDSGVFDFNNFTKTYEGLKNNKPIYNKILTTIGGDKKQILDDLNEVSKRITEARKNILTTGKANQEILKKFQEEALAEKVIKFTIQKGQLYTGGLFGSGLQELLFKTPKEKLSALGDLLKSNQFYELSRQAISGTPSEQSIKSLVNSKQFKRWTKAIGKEIKEPESFILNSLILQQGQENDNF